MPDGAETFCAAGGVEPPRLALLHYTHLLHFRYAMLAVVPTPRCFLST